MRLLVIGGDGMAGHIAAAKLALDHEVFATTRRAAPPSHSPEGSGPVEHITSVDVRDTDRLARLLDVTSPDIIVNCAGIVKQRDVTAVEMLEVNAVFPHQLAELAAATSARLIHLSTDCVFSGRRGFYSEEDIPDPIDFYGVSKLAGEPDQRALTLRTSIIGLELTRRSSLIEWALAAGPELPGYTHAVFSGVTTLALADVLNCIVSEHPDLRGIWHLAAEPISKFELLRRLFDQLHRDVRLVADPSVTCDRSLDGRRLNTLMGSAPPSWDTMIAELASSILQREGQA